MWNYCWSWVVVVLFVSFRTTHQQNATNPRRGPHRDSQLLSAVQLLQVQMTNLETEAQRQGARIGEVLRTTARLETQRQEIIGSLDRTESRLTQRIDDVKGEARKIVTLQDIMREDIDKIQQNQLLNKVWLEEQLRHMSTSVAISRPDPFADPNAIQSSADILANLQILQSTLTSLRRMADTLQSSIGILKINMTDLTNVTRSMMKYEQESLVTKSYFQSTLQMFMDDRSDHPLVGWFNPTTNQADEEKLPKDCYEVQQQVQNKSGIYRIRLQYATKPMFVYCDMDTDEGGWTVFQRRLDGSTEFLREWQDYKHGFGNVGGEFWIGNENLYLLTHQDLYELRVDLSDFEGNTAYAKYGGFAVGSEKEKYMLKLLGPYNAGDAGDGMTYHASMAFSTIDADYDRWQSGHCAVDHTGGWWYNQCDASNLNGKYLRGLNPQEYQGVYWHEWQGPSYSLQSTSMMIRPTRNQYLPLRNMTTASVGVHEDVEHQTVDGAHYEHEEGYHQE